MNAIAARVVAVACSTATSSSSCRAFSSTPAARSRALASSSSSRSRLALWSPSDFHVKSKSTSMSRSFHQFTLRAVPEVADALGLVALPASAGSVSLADALSSSSSSSTPTAETAATAATALAASIARYASAAMLTLVELTNEATAAVTAEETRVVRSLAKVIIPSSTSTSSAPLHLLASLPASIFDPPHPEPANALSLPTWAIHVSSVAEWVVAMNLFWKLGGIPGGTPQWRGMSWGMTPLLGGALCACTFHFFYNSPALEPLVALQAGLTVVGNATMWFAAWRVFESTRGRREAEDDDKEKKKEREKQQQA